MIDILPNLTIFKSIYRSKSFSNLQMGSIQIEHTYIVQLLKIKDKKILKAIKGKIRNSTSANHLLLINSRGKKTREQKL